MAAARTLFAATPLRFRRPGRWLQPRGLVRGRPTLEYNRIYDPALPPQWLGGHLGPVAARPRDGRAPLVTTTGVVTEPARWWLRHRYRIIAADCSVVLLTVLLALAPLTVGGPWSAALGTELEAAGEAAYPQPTLWALAIAAAWLALLSVSELWSVGALRSGQATTRPLVRSAVALFASTGVVAFLLGDPSLRVFLVLSLPLGLLSLILVRQVSAHHVRTMRTSGALPGVVLLAGPHSDIGRRLSVWLPQRWGAATTVRIEDADAPAPESVSTDDPVDHLQHRVRLAGADLLVIAEPERFTPGQIAALAWTALAVGTDLMVPAPSTGGRLVRPTSAAVALFGGSTPRSGVPDLGLICVDPRERPSVRAGRIIIDRVLAAIALVLLLPVVLVATIAAAIAEGPPVFIEGERVGRDGGVFRMWAFRCAASTPGGSGLDRRGAESAISALTPIGRLLRRSGLENVPALLNVLSGDLALVGPRPLAPTVGTRPPVTPWLRPGLTGRWRDPAREDISQTDGEHLWRDLQLVARLVGRRLRGPSRPV